MTVSERAEAREVYRNGPELLEQCLRQIPQEAMDYSPGPGRWSIHQIVIHIVDADINSFIRLRRPLAEPGGEVPVYSQEDWATRLHSEAIPVGLALELFRVYRLYNEAYLNAVSETEWSQQIVHPEAGLMTLDDVLALYSAHPVWHIDHITRTFEVYRRFRAGETIDPTVSLWVNP